MTENQTDLPPTKEKQEKALTLSYIRASHNCPQCGQFQGFQSTLFFHGKS